MTNSKILSVPLIKSFLILCTFVLLCGQKAAAQGWETFIGSNATGVYASWQPFSTGDGNYLTYNTKTDSLGRRVAIYKLNAYGDIVWSLEFPQTNNNNPPYPILACGNGEFVTSYLSTVGGVDSLDIMFFVKFDSDGNTVWEHEVIFPTNEGDFISSFEWINAPDGGFYFYVGKGYFGSQIPDERYLGKMSCDGDLESFKLLPTPLKLSVNEFFYIDDELHVLGVKIFPSTTREISYAKVEGDSAFSEPIVFENVSPSAKTYLKDDNNYLFYSQEGGEIIQTKTDLLGNLLSENVIYEEEGLFLERTYNVGDGFISTGAIAPTAPDEERTGFAIKSNLDGELVWTKFYNHRNTSTYIRGVTNAHDGGYILTGQNGAQGYILKVDSMGNIYNNSLFGNVSIDVDMDCDTSSVDIPIANWLVTAEKSGDTFVGSTDSIGNYFIPVDTGTYVVTCHYPNDYWTSCRNDSLVLIPDFDNEINIDYSIGSVVDCPQMTIDGNTPFVRPCFDRPAFFQYCNQGTVVAADAKIEITLDPAITATASNPPWTSQVGNTYIFELGDLASLECGNFSMSLFLDCDASLGDTYSVKAQAFPDTLCTPTNPLYSGAFIEITGICDEVETIFTIENIGDQPMASPAAYIIVEDAVWRSSDDVQLLPGEREDVSLPSNGATYTMLANQVENAPGVSNPLVVLEGCGTNDDGEYSTGFSNQFGLDDGLPACDLDLVEARSSFDPNAKSAYPEGYSTPHYIRPNTPLEYIIYFQNTGSDTAFTVVLRDTLDQWLDLGSFEAGASSHNYSYKFEEHRTLKFTFNNINLPDSSANQLASNGFVSFKLTPKSTTPLSTVIKNKAAIYFDFNEPIITNETFHTIAEDFIEVIITKVSGFSDSKPDIVVSPNPFIDQTVMHIQNHKADTYQLHIYDLHGRLVRQEIHHRPDILLKRNALIEGIYFYQVESNKGLSVSGRLMVK